MREYHTRHERIAQRIGRFIGFWGVIAFAVTCGLLWLWGLYAVIAGTARWAVSNAENIALLIVAVGIVVAVLRLAWNIGGRNR